MERILARLERRVGRYAIPNLIVFIVGGMAVVWFLSLSKPEFPLRLALDMRAVRRGEVWRLVTFLFIPPPSSPLWIMLNLYFAWWVGSSLEQHWGAFRFNVYYLLGALGTIVASLIAGPATNVWLNASLFLAFATVFPDMRVLLLFVIPIPVKWLGLLAALGMAWSAAAGDWATRGAIAASFVNYALFFGERGLLMVRQRRPSVQSRAARVRSLTHPAPEPEAPVLGHRVCAICHAREADGADIRVCSCEFCGGRPRMLCLPHARNHARIPSDASAT